MTRSCWQSRRSTGAVLSALLLTAATGCPGDRGPSDDQKKYDEAAIPAAHTMKPGETTKQVDAFAEMPTPPADAQYTIYCQVYAGPDHQEVARQVRDLLRANTSMGKWYIVHGGEQSTLYYGFYRTIDRSDPNDPEEGKRAINDLNAIRTLHDSRGARLFSASLPVSINTPDPAANPKWDLARTGAYWSLDIATFKDTPDRKMRAVQAVTEARQQGLEAYYLHGPHTSEVCIGAWPEKAAVEIDTGMQNTNPNLPLFVTPTPMAPGAMGGMDPNVQVAAPRVDPVDPSMLAAIATWKEHAVDGSVQMKVDPVTHQATNEPLPAYRAFLFKVPASESAADGRLPTSEAGGADPTVTVAPAAPAGSGQLRSLDDAH